MGKLKALWARWRAWRLTRRRRREFVVEDDGFSVGWSMSSSSLSFSSDGSAAAPLFAGAGGTFDGGGASGDWSDSSSDSGGSDSGGSDGGGGGD